MTAVISRVRIQLPYYTESQVPNPPPGYHVEVTRLNSVSDKRVLVTGANGGIGRATAEAFIAGGAEVTGIDRSTVSVDFPMIACDVSAEQQVTDTVNMAHQQMGGIDVLVNCAGLLREEALCDINTSHIDELFDVNVKGTILMAREVVPLLPDGGRIINIASELAYPGRAHTSVYVATKAAVIGLTRSWARELAPRILVNAVAPGPTDTPMLNFTELTEQQQAAETDNPMGRIGTPAEIAAAVVFLAGSGATYFTGQCLCPSGGAVML